MKKILFIVFFMLLNSYAYGDFFSFNTKNVDLSGIFINVADTMKKMPEQMAQNYMNFASKMAHVFEQAMTQIVDAFKDFLSNGNFTIPPPS